MKTGLLLVLFMFLGAGGANLKTVRNAYPDAFANKELAAQMHEHLDEVRHADGPVLVAYKAAYMALQAHHSEFKKDKISYFKQAKALFIVAMRNGGDNIEVRCLRLSIQSNSPAALRYKTNIAEDKEYLLHNFSSTTDRDVKEAVRRFCLDSKVFTAQEKEVFN